MGLGRLDRDRQTLVVEAASNDGDMLRVAVGNPYPRNAPSEGGNRHAQDSIAQRLIFRFGDRARMTVQDSGGYYLCTLLIPIEPRATTHANSDS